MREPEVAHLGLFHELEHPRFGRMTAMHRAVRIGGERESSPLPPPALGEHTDEVLRDALGLEPAAIAALRAKGTFGKATH
jgi:crotonobetainyl-CoA:carnitine CoA-transferase CaiB-like acyl-CoA transferase